MDYPISQALAAEFLALSEVDSTNLELARRANELPEFSVLVAERQLAGQGRLGRTWVTGEHGLAVSILLRPAANWASWCTLLGAVSVARALEEFGLAPKIKWPNDVLVGGKKLCGILAQLLPDGSVILGVGINLAFPDGAPDTATSIADQGLQLSKDQLLANFLAAFRSRYFLFTEASEFAISKTLNELQTLSGTLGQPVRAEFPDGRTLEGEAVAIDRSGQLVIQADQLVTISAADIWHLRN